jgi:hypothetical protein
MRPAVSLSLVAVGGILALAVHGHPGFLNLQVAGWVLMLTGLAGLLAQRLRHGWLRRSWLLVIGKPGRLGPPHIESGGRDHRVSGWAVPVAADPQAPDADFPTLPDILAGDGVGTRSDRPDSLAGEPVT